MRALKWLDVQKDLIGYLVATVVPDQQKGIRKEAICYVFFVIKDCK